MKNKVLSTKKSSKLAKTGDGLVKFGNRIVKHSAKISMLLVVVMMAMMMTTAVFASDPTVTNPSDPAEDLWTTLATLIGKWVTRLGAVIIFVGGIMFALGWKSDDAEQKSRGIATVISGALVTALAAMVGTFFA